MAGRANDLTTAGRISQSLFSGRSAPRTIRRFAAPFAEAHLPAPHPALGREIIEQADRLGRQHADGGAFGEMDLLLAGHRRTD